MNSDCSDTEETEPDLKIKGIAEEDDDEEADAPKKVYVDSIDNTDVYEESGPRMKPGIKRAKKNNNNDDEADEEPKKVYVDNIDNTDVYEETGPRFRPGIKFAKSSKDDEGDDDEGPKIAYVDLMDNTDIYEESGPRRLSKKPKFVTVDEDNDDDVSHPPENYVPVARFSIPGNDSEDSLTALRSFTTNHTNEPKTPHSALANKANANGTTRQMRSVSFSTFHHTPSNRQPSNRISVAVAPPHFNSQSFIDLQEASERVHTLLQEETDDVHTPHHIFCELHELRKVGDNGHCVWKETARWIKFEEDVEEEGNRWSKPHVASLSMHSLYEVRNCIATGSILLDIQNTYFPDLVDRVIDDFLGLDLISEDKTDELRDVILKEHQHQFQTEAHHKSVVDQSKTMVRKISMIGRKPLDIHPSASDLSVKSRERSLSKADLKSMYDMHFAKKVPSGSETANILVGEVDFLDTPVMAFVRLHKAVLFDEFTEVPVPTRFLFLLVGPKTGDSVKKSYHEIGRSVATLMSDEIFHSVAYKAESREDLLMGLDEFLDQVTVLPPGEWDPNIRIEPPSSVPSQESRYKMDDEKDKVMCLTDDPEQPEAKEEDDVDLSLMRTGKLFGGLILDIKRKVPFYISDFKDALHPQCLASWWFMYFAILSPIVTFGGLLGAATDNNIAAMECLLSGAVAGITFHLFSGQPLTIISSTGPMLVFETIIYNLSSQYGFHYLSFRFWIGIWVSIALMIIVAFDLSALVRYITRFTEECFASLIALIFIVESFKKLFKILDKNPVNTNPDEPLDYSCLCVPDGWNGADFSKVADNVGGLISNLTATSPENATDPLISSLNASLNYRSLDKYQCSAINGTLFGSGCDTPQYVADVFFFSCLLFVFTFILANGLKMFRNTGCFPTKVRVLVSDFAVIISILLMLLVDYFVGINTPKLTVPSSFRPTRSDRGWIIDPFENPVWVIPLAILPALLATILIFMDQQITAVIVNRKENLLAKGKGYHLDIFLLAILIAVCSLLGIPWFVAATVESMNHVKSLTVESGTAAPGEKPKFLGVREQRVTGALTFVLVGLSVLATDALKIIPMPVLYGVFLFMGFSSLRGFQFIARVVIVFMPKKYQPDYAFLRMVPLKRVHLFTFIQLLCLIALWVIKSINSISIIFPLMVLLLCFIRKLLEKIFTIHELKWLDDIMPESHQPESEKKEEKEPESTQEIDIQEIAGGVIKIPLADGRVISVPVDNIKFDAQSKEVMVGTKTKTALWKQLTGKRTSTVENGPNSPAFLKIDGHPNAKHEMSSSVDLNNKDSLSIKELDV